MTDFQICMGTGDYPSPDEYCTDSIPTNTQTYDNWYEREDIKRIKQMVEDGRLTDFHSRWIAYLVTRHEQQCDEEDLY